MNAHAPGRRAPWQLAAWQHVAWASAGRRPVCLLWLATALLVALAVLVPLLWLMGLAAQGNTAQWRHLAMHVLPVALRNTGVLLLGVGVTAALVGTGMAWLVAAYRFPGHRHLRWALLLPLAMPTYIVAYVYLDMLHPIGAVQGAMRAVLGVDSPRDFRLPDLRSMGGAVLVLGAVLYPYVYLTMHAMFVTQPAHLLEAARVLGRSRWGAFWHVALPMARPAFAAGLSLALLETLNDIGASEFLGVNTLTVAIYTSWVTRSDLPGAAQIACAMLAIVALLIALESHGRRHQRYGSVARMRAMQPTVLHGARAWLATAAASLPVLLGFVAPALHLLVQAAQRARVGHGVSRALLDGLWHTLVLATVVTVLAVAGGLCVAWAGRSVASRHSALKLLPRIAALGYAVPGTVLAIGVLGPGLWLDAALADALQLPGLPLMSLGLLLVGTCTLRFLAMPINGIEGGLARIPPQLEQAARSLGRGHLATLWRVHLPLLRPALVTGALLVFVDAMKELPATLLLRPPNVETLATLLYADAARGSYEDGALAALAIVAAGIVPVVVLARWQMRTGATR